MGRLRRALAGLALVGLAAVIPSACSDTAGRPIAVPVSLQGVGEPGASPATFTNGRGWQVTLTQAHALLGPFYFDEVAQDAFAWWTRWLPIGVAHAHVLASQGTTIGELLAQYPVDLLAPTVALGEASGQLGTCRRFEVHLRPPGAVRLADGADLTPLRGHSLYAEGTATKDGVTVRFAGGLDLPSDDRALQAVTDIRVADVRFDDARPGGPQVRVRVSDWFWQADFSTLPPADADGVASIPADSPVAQGWLRAATHRDTYDLEWIP